MPLAKSKVTSQGQISVPAEVRRKLGIGPGATLEWDEDGDKIVVRRSGKVTFEDMRKALFPNGPPRPRTLKELKEGIHQYIRERHARR